MLAQKKQIALKLFPPIVINFKELNIGLKNFNYARKFIIVDMVNIGYALQNIRKKFPLQLYL
jgi:hypothetical protein